VGCPVISGYVFLDENANPALTNNGLFNPGELVIPNAQVVLEDANHNVIETTTTDANGHYQFQKMPSPSDQSTTVTQSVSIPSTLTNFSDKALSPAVQLFDPSLGTLTSVTIARSVTFNSAVTAQNLSQNSSAAITATFDGSYQLNGLGAPFSGSLSTSQGPEIAGPFDPNNPNGNEIPPFVLSQTDAPSAMTFTDAATLAFFTSSAGRTTLTPTLSATGAGTATAPNGNLAISAMTSVLGSATISFTYIPKECITPGQYYLVQTPLVPNVTDGKASENGVVFSDPGSPQTLALTVGNTDLPNNDFGKLTPGSITSPTPPSCPTVESLVRFGVHQQQSQLIVTFAGTVDPTKANDPSNYYIFSSTGQYIPIKSATFDPTSNSVTLIPQKQINVHYRFDLSVTLPCANGCDKVVVPFGGKDSLGGFTNHQGQFVPVRNGRIASGGASSSPNAQAGRTPHVAPASRTQQLADRLVTHPYAIPTTAGVDMTGLASLPAHQRLHARRALRIATFAKSLPPIY